MGGDDVHNDQETEVETARRIARARQRQQLAEIETKIVYETMKQAQMWVSILRSQGDALTELEKVRTELNAAPVAPPDQAADNLPASEPTEPSRSMDHLICDELNRATRQRAWERAKSAARAASELANLTELAHLTLATEP